MKRLFDVDPWKIKTESLHHEDKRLQESLTSIGNGYMGQRGNFEEGYSGDGHEGTYLAGVWYPDKTRVGWWKIGYPEYFGKVINAMNFIQVDIQVDGEKVDLAKDDFREFYLESNMYKGTLYRTFIWSNKEKTTEIHFEFNRFLSIVEKETASIQVRAEVLKGNPEITLRPGLDNRVHNEDTNYDEMFWEQVEESTQKPAFVTAKTVTNDFGIERFTVTGAMINEVTGLDQKESESEKLQVRECFSGKVTKGSVVTLNKYVALVTSRDISEERQKGTARKLVEKAAEKGQKQLLSEHTTAWKERWQKSDVNIHGDEESQQGVRFNLYELFSTYYGEDSRLNIGPKGFTGEKYGGATYWDTEAFLLPMYLSVADPKVSRNLLRYRYDQLEGAFHNAQQQGLKGALYPMVTFTGVECHNEWEITFEEIHRNGAIAHAIYNYANYTGDETYLLDEGIEVLVELSRFWADRVHFSKRHQKYMIHGVTGPNEYENNINNNYHTNNMALWTLEYTLETFKKVVGQHKEKSLNVTEKELIHWADIVEKMYIPYDDELDIFVQHDTFLDKDIRSVDTLDPSVRPLNQHWSWDKILRSPFIKQADVLQSMYYFPDRYTQEQKEKNFDYYEPLTVHESSLSPSVHAVLAAELGKEDKAVELYARTARLDLDNYNNDTEDGLHITSMSGAWLAIVQGFAGMRVRNAQLSFQPFVPKGWDGYDFKINFHDRLLDVTIEKDKIILKLEEGKPLDIILYGEKVTVKDEFQKNI
ncbi:glycoside hydrolase family 65 protein [Jeotgalibaca sp. MA1X17-3]|uniref:glycoside hydrolase family 65 protein n=1 Tax=Jeotgalibaca sp. MA1X17-3 TaxID=2908211 RepID=UPI001F37824F|nr:glycoside hydrolase family 65 protein [Jeotgalibaca sp. MA1X17-3]UJF15212.1 glycoside hydrolase family 65 protein [Jeotgalibaca sp. MA1X17-3]